MAKCFLCKQEAALRKSHILPAFAFRWLRARSLTTHIRSTEAIDRRIQDGPKKPWLCGPCEHLLGRSEQSFSSKLFHPWVQGQCKIEYHEWLHRFCTSVSWRVLAHCKGSNPAQVYTSAEDAAAVEAELVWREYLLGHRSGVGKYEQHLLPLGVISDTTIPDLPNNINRYLSGPIEMDIVGTSKMLMTYAKLGPFMIFGFIVKGGGKWSGTRVNAQHGRLPPRRIELPGELAGFITDRAKLVADATDAMSPTQKAKVEASILENGDQRASAEYMEALLADIEMFGEDGIVSWD